jgi:hypothetical protein
VFAANNTDCVSAPIFLSLPRYRAALLLCCDRTDGTNWEESFCFALANSLIFCCIVSERCWSSFIDFDDSSVDNVLLEYLIAFELAAINKLQIFPLFVVEKGANSGVFFPSEILPQIPDIVPSKTIQRCNVHLRRLGFAPSSTADASLPALLGRMLTFQGMVTDFDGEAHQCTIRVSTAVSSVLAGRGRPASSIISKELGNLSNSNMLQGIMNTDSSDLRNMSDLVKDLGHMMDANMHEGSLVADCAKKLREAADQSDEHRSLVSTEYVVSLVIEAVRFHLSESPVALECMTLLRRCARCSFTSLIISRIGGVAVVVQCAEVHMSNESIIEQCLYLLCNLGMVPALVLELREHCVDDMVRIALKRYSTNRSLADTASSIRKTILFAGDGDAATVLHAIKTDLQDKELLAACARWLRLHAASSEENREQVAHAEDGLAPMLCALQEYMRDVEVALEIVHCFRYLARGQEICIALAEAGCIELVVQCAEMHMSNESIIEQCVYLLRNLGMVPALVLELRERDASNVAKEAITKYAGNRALADAAAHLTKLLVPPEAGSAVKR